MRRKAALLTITAILTFALFNPKTSFAQVSTNTELSVTIGTLTGSVRIVGDAFPNALVFFLVNNAVAGSQLANSNSGFDYTISGLSPGIKTFGLYAQSNDGRTTLTISFSLNVITGMTIIVSGILLPTILTVPPSIKRPQYLTQNGLAKNNSTITSFTYDGESYVRTVPSNHLGQWTSTLDEILHLGQQRTRAMVTDQFGTQSEFTAWQEFLVLLSADLNLDNLVNLTDFSILMFNYGRSSIPNRAADINDDTKADLVDFSIMMFYWTK